MIPGELRAELQRLWTERGAVSAEKFWERVKRAHIPATRAQVVEFSRSVADKATELFLSPPRYEGKAYARGPNSQWKVDLLDRSSDGARGFRYALIVMDAWSRKVWAEPVVGKTADQVAAAFSKILEEGETPETVMSDSGSEFKGAFAALCAQRGIVCLTKDPRDHGPLSILDNFIRTLRMREGIFLQERNADWVEALPHTVKNWNEDPGRNTGVAPDEADEPLNKMWLNLQNNAAARHNGVLSKRREAALKERGGWREVLGENRFRHRAQTVRWSEARPVAKVEDGIVTDGQGHTAPMKLARPAVVGERERMEELHDHLEHVGEVPLAVAAQRLRDVAEGPAVVGEGAVRGGRPPPLDQRLRAQPDLFRVEGGRVRPVPRADSPPRSSESSEIRPHAVVKGANTILELSAYPETLEELRRLEVQMPGSEEWRRFVDILADPATRDQWYRGYGGGAVQRDIRLRLFIQRVLVAFIRKQQERGPVSAAAERLLAAHRARQYLGPSQLSDVMSVFGVS